MKWLKRLGIFFLILYILLCGALYVMQEELLFLEDKLPSNHTFRTGQEVQLEVEEGIALSCLMMREQNAKGVILYLHGNKGSIRRCIGQAQSMAGNQYDIFMPDYRSYGKSDGNPKSESQLYADVQVIYDYLKKSYAEENIVVVGYSLGTGMASYLAAHNKPQQLALVAPYFSIVDMKNRILPIIPTFLMKYQFRTNEFLPKVTCPVNLFHATNDRVIYYDSAKKLEAINPSQIKLHTQEGGNHRSIIFSELFRRTMSELLR